MEISEKLKAAMKKAATVNLSGNGVLIRQYGNYVFMVDKWFFKQGHKGLSDIHELVTMKAEKVTVYEDEKKVEVDPHAVGSRVSAIFNYDGKGKDMAPINSMRFLLGLFGVNEADISDEDKEASLAQATGKDNPTQGMLIACEVYPAKTNAGRWIAVCRWSCVDKPGEGQNAPDVVKKRWAEYEAKRKKLEDKSQQATA